VTRFIVNFNKNSALSILEVWQHSLVPSQAPIKLARFFFHIQAKLYHSPRPKPRHRWQG